MESGKSYVGHRFWTTTKKQSLCHLHSSPLFSGANFVLLQLGPKADMLADCLQVLLCCVALVLYMLTIVGVIWYCIGRWDREDATDWQNLENLRVSPCSSYQQCAQNRCNCCDTCGSTMQCYSLNQLQLQGSVQSSPHFKHTAPLMYMR